MITQDVMEGSRGLLSRLSTASTGSETVLQPSCGNCMELIHDLYQKLEPQISKSYRPNVKYVPSPEVFEPSEVGNHHTKKQKQIKTAKIVIDAVNELQTRSDTKVAIQKRRDSNVKFSNLARRASRVDSIDTSLLKHVSLSLPNLSETDS